MDFTFELLIIIVIVICPTVKSVQPVISVVPTNQNKIEGSDVIFRCESSGVPVPTINWLFNGAPIQWRHTIDRRGSLILKNVTHGTHDGRYTCMAANKAGKVSHSARLTVYIGASAQAKKRRYVFSLDSEYIILTCFGRGYPFPKITWTKNGSPVSFTQTDIVINKTFVESKIHLGTFTYKKAGNYLCNARNWLPDSVYIPKPRGVIIEALLHPIILERPSDQNTTGGSNVVLKCNTSGVPQPTNTWLFNGKPIPFHHSIDKGSLVIENVAQKTHAGKYTCVASSKAGKASDSAWLFIAEACPNDWSEGPSSCYRIVTTPTAKWDDARKSCISMGGYLVKINSDEENRFVTNLASKSSSKQYMWIGLSKISRSEFHWTDGTSLKGRYSKWNDGEPNNAKGNENCAHMYVHGSAASSWNDHICNYESRPFFACERGKLY